MYTVSLHTFAEGGMIMLEKMICLPFTPFDGLTICEKSHEEGGVADEYVITAVYWRLGIFECHVAFGLGQELMLDVGTLTSRGWEESK